MTKMENSVIKRHFSTSMALEIKGYNVNMYILDGGKAREFNDFDHIIVFDGFLQFFVITYVIVIA